MKILESSENYLEAIYILGAQSKPVRSIDVAGMLSVSKPSVSVAMKKLVSEGCIQMLPNGQLQLTDTGLQIARTVHERHVFLSRWLTALGVEPQVAERDACRLEHVISAESFAALQRHVAQSGEIGAE